MSRLRDRLRFGFVLFHLTAVTVLSVPAPVGARMDATWKERHVRSQVLEWVAPFRSLLEDRSDEQVLTLTRAVATRMLNVRDLVIAPFVPYTRAVGAGQGWQLFGSLKKPTTLPALRDMTANSASRQCAMPALRVGTTISRLRK